MPQGKQAHVDSDVLHAVQEENDPQQKEQVVVTGDHVFGTEVGKSNQVYAGNLLNVSLVALGDGMGQRIRAETEQAQCQEYPEKTISAGSNPRPRARFAKQS